MSAEAARHAVRHLEDARAARDDDRARTAAEELAALLDLPRVGLSIEGARIVGRGSGASADLYLSDNTTVTFETLRDFANASRLAVEMAACTGATPRLKAPQAVQALAKLREVAEHRATFTADEFAVEWGTTYLQAAAPLDVDMTDQAERWQAFTMLESLDPVLTARLHGIPLVQACRHLRHADGTRFVRTGWFRLHVRQDDPTASPQQIAQRMERVGWQRRGGEGRIKATRPGLEGSLVWTFYAVPAGWEDDPVGHHPQVNE